MSVLGAIPDVDAHDLHRLDEKLCSQPARPSKTDKSKRELFKKITARVSCDSCTVPPVLLYTQRQ